MQKKATAVVGYMNHRCNRLGRYGECTICAYYARSKDRWLKFLEEIDTVNKRIDEREKLKEVR